jgi:hypothetical protein
VVVITPKNKREENTEKWFKQILDYTIEKDQPLWKEPRSYIRGSEVGDLCYRSLALSMLGHSVPFDAKTLRIFETGNHVEAGIIKVLRDAEILASAQGEIRIETEFDGDLVVGHYDAVIERPGSGEFLLLEIKSINENAFDKLPEEHGLVLAGESPVFNKYPKYIHQWNTYSYAVDRLDGVLLFEAKNTQRQKAYFLMYDDSLFQGNLAKLQLAKFYANTNRIPQVPKGANPQDNKNKICGYCPRRYLCSELPEDGVDLKTIREKDAELRG